MPACCARTTRPSRSWSTAPSPPDEVGEFEKLYTKWFTSPIPPKGVNLNLPMSEELKENLKAFSDKPAT
jgi:hypothetical protein